MTVVATGSVPLENAGQVSERMQGGELVDGALQTEAARHQDQDVWVVSGDLLPGHLHGRRPLAAVGVVR
jgi:hypothetical protein